LVGVFEKNPKVPNPKFQSPPPPPEKMYDSEINRIFEGERMKEN